jgi:hypothetical protein
VGRTLWKSMLVDQQFEKKSPLKLEGRKELEVGMDATCGRKGVDFSRTLTTHIINFHSEGRPKVYGTYYAHPKTTVLLVEIAASWMHQLFPACWPATVWN